MQQRAVAFGIGIRRAFHFAQRAVELAGGIRQGRGFGDDALHQNFRFEFQHTREITLLIGDI